MIPIYYIISEGFWPNIRENIRTQIKVFKTCPIKNRQILKCGHLTAKVAEAIQWDRLLVDFISPYEIRREYHKFPLSLTMVEPSTGWFEIIQYKDKREATIENLVENTWQCRYQSTKIITHDCGNEFLGHALKNNLIKTEYGIKSKCATKPNPQLS